MTTRLPHALSLCFLLSACSDPSAPVPVAEPAPATATAQTQGGRPEPVAAVGQVPDVPQIPEDVVVSTNEPFWQARVEAGTLVLAGPQGERRMDIQSNDFHAGTRRIVARDAKGRLEATVTATSCEDDMSGIAFPYTGTLSFDGAQQIRGCARGASMPLPAALPEG